MRDLPRRVLLTGGATTAVAAGLAAVGTGTADPLMAQATRGHVLDRRALAGRQPAIPGELVFLDEGGRAGLFRWIDGTPPADDPLQGLYIAAGGGHYARVWDGTHGRPEWFGARPNEPAFDCADALEACYALCPFTQLSQADYFVQRTLHFNRSWRTVRGVGNYANDQGQGTRIILQRRARGLHTDDIMVVGSRAKPSATSDGFPFENHFSNFTLIRDGACTPHPSRDVTRYPTGLRAAYLVRCTFREITSLESSVGFYIGGIVYTKFDDCMAQRMQPGTQPEHDFAIGYYLDGHIDFGYAGGNASLYIRRCIAVGQHPAHVEAAGLCGRGAFVDTFLDDFESARIATGITFGVDGAINLAQSVDLHIRNPVLDGCAKFGIQIDLHDTSTASIEIIDPYIYAAGGGGDRGILVYDGAGLVTITGGQVHGDFAGGSLWFSRTRGIKVQGTKIQQALRPIVAANASGLFLEPQINNSAKRTGNFAIECHALARCIIRPVIIGAGPPAFRGGINLDAGCNYSQIDGSGIDQGCFETVDARLKICFADGDARAGASGAAFQRAGNVITGVRG